MTKIKLTGNRVAPEETQVCTIDMTPTWEATARLLLVVLENGTTGAKIDARAEVERMGILLDSLIAARKDECGGVAKA